MFSGFHGKTQKYSGKWLSWLSLRITRNALQKTNKIPDYARGYKNEYLFIRGINKTCEKFVKILDQEGEISVC